MKLLATGMCVPLYLSVPRPVSVCRNNYEIIYVGHVTDTRVGVERGAWNLETGGHGILSCAFLRLCLLRRK